VHEVFIILAVINARMGGSVMERPSRFIGSNLSECISVLNAEPVYDPTSPYFTIDTPPTDPREQVHFLREFEQLFNRKAAEGRRPLKATLSCEEREVPEPWDRIAPGDIWQLTVLLR